MFDWNDVRHFLAVARTGSTLAAARELKVNQTTCARRIEALETALGQRLFDRTQSGRKLTETGCALLPCAEEMEKAARTFADEAATLTRGLVGTLRLTASETMANLWLAPAMVEFRKLYPDIQLELITADRFLDLVKGEADIALRAAARPTDAGCVVRKLVDVPWSIYCSHDYAERHGRPAGPHDLNGHLLIGGVEGLEQLWAMRWMSEMAPQAKVHCRSNTLTNLFYSVKAGLGVAPLPSTMGDQDPGLLRCSDDVPELEATCWLIFPERLRRAPRVRAFLDFITPYMAATQKSAMATSPQAASS